ncbi:MAG: hypothetical protein ACYCOO_08245 [Chitinophagaceae bacterium]
MEFFLHQIADQIFVEANRCFRITLFGNRDANLFYNETIRDYLKEMTINVYRSDDFSDNDVIIETIYREIEKSEFVICEVSECNKNVFFEIGYAKAMKKELIFLLQRGIENKFFDVAHIRRIDNETGNPVEFQGKLEDTIATIRERS